MSKFACKYCGAIAPEGTECPEGHFVLCPSCEVKFGMANAMAEYILLKLGLSPSLACNCCQTCGQAIEPGKDLCAICASFTRFVDEPKLVSQTIDDSKIINPADLK